MLVGKVIAITDADEFQGRVDASLQATYMIEIKHRFHEARWQIDDHPRLATGSTPFHERNQNIQIRRMNKILAGMQDWKRQFDEGCEVAPRSAKQLAESASVAIVTRETSRISWPSLCCCSLPIRSPALPAPPLLSFCFGRAERSSKCP